MTVYGRLNRSPLGPALSALPVPVRFHDGRRRISTVAIWRLHRVWRSHPSLVEESRAVYEAYRGGDVVDVGAFEGWYSVLLAPKAGDATLVSCEPDAIPYRELQTTLALLGRAFPDATFMPTPVAVGDGTAVAVSQPDGAHPRFAGGATIDGLVETLGIRPGFVKIDVEGAEPFVLRGMERTLREHRPVVMLELHPRWLPEGTAPADVTELLSAQGYTSRTIATEDVATRSIWTP